MSSVFILTSGINAYDQAGEYFEAVFKEMPTPEELISNCVPEQRVNHVMEGGGRVGCEDKWFYLREVDL